MPQASNKTSKDNRHALRSIWRGLVATSAKARSAGVRVISLRSFSMSRASTAPSCSLLRRSPMVEG